MVNDDKRRNVGGEPRPAAPGDVHSARLITSDAGPNLDRRSVLRGGLSAGSAALLPFAVASCSTPPQTPPPDALPADLAATLAAFANRIVPPDASGPGAGESGAARYINRSLGQWNQNDLALVTNGLQALEQAAIDAHAMAFAALQAGQQDALMLAMEAGQLPGFGNAQQVFSRLHRLVLEGMFSDPWYGGNINYAGWDLIGYPGAVLGSTEDMQRMGGRLPALHTSAYGEAFDGEQHDGH